MADLDKARESERALKARFRQIAHGLQRAIESGIYKPGDQLPTEMELAREHHVSRVTAGAALGELARAGLVTRTPRRGTIVRAGARFGRASDRPFVAWIVDRVESAFGLSLLRGIQRGVREAGFGLLLCNSGVTHEDEEQAIRDAVAWGAAGTMIFIQDGEHYNAEVLRLVLGGYPIVLVDRYLRGVHCAVVSSDNVDGSRMLVQELLDAGHHRICVLTFAPSDTSTIEDRIRGYVQALTAAGVPVDYSLHYVTDDVFPMMQDWEPPPAIVGRFVDFLNAHPDVTAIYATNEELALIAYRATEWMHLRIPEDISLVCIDPLEAIPLSVPRVTAALQQGTQIGVTAVQLLQELMAGKPPRTVLLPMQVRRAGTIGPPAPRPGAVEFGSGSYTTFSAR